ncbi:MAG: hypothetical protein JNJ54_35750 [Myxococcaceae bacterium]|nr:hypothetical protein [Myxococcaceae bacterium]
MSVVLAVCASPAFAQFELDLSADKKDPKADSKAPKPAPAPAAQPRSAPPPEVGLDLSSTADVKKVVVLPAIVRVTQSQGGFSGLDTKKTFDKFDFASHKRFIASVSKQLEGKVLSAEAVQAAITKEGFTIALARTPAGRAKLIKSLEAGFLVLLEVGKTGTLSAVVHDVEGAEKGEALTVGGGVTQKAADELGPLLSKRLIDLSNEKPAQVAVVEAPPPPPEEDVNDSPPEIVKEAPKSWKPDPDVSRVTVAVGAGGVVRSLTVGGEAASQLAELRNNGVVGLGLYAQVQPLQFIKSMAGSRWADLELEVNFRRAFVRATGVEGSAQGTSCSMTDDDLQVRGTYRFKVAAATYAPFVGVGAGWSQERTLFDACSLPLVSATWRGIDAQVRVKQPLFRNLLSLDLAGGPRFLQSGQGTSTRLSLSGEAWLELKPAHVFFVRGGARVSRLSAELPGLTLAENRLFFALEAGAFF